MKITKTLKNLTKGTQINACKGDFGWYILTSDYDALHGAYYADRYTLDDDDNEIKIDENVLLTPADLIGNELA